MHEIAHTTQYAVHGAIAFFGAVVHALDSHRKGTSKTILDFVTLTVMSSFSGVMFALLGLQFFPEQIYFTTALAGTGGYLGVEGMSIIVSMIKKRLNIK